MEIVVTVLVTAVVAGAVVAWVVSRQQRAATVAVLRSVREELEHQQDTAALALSDRNRQDLDRAVDTLRRVAQEQLEGHTRSGTQQLDTRKQLIDAELARVAGTVEQLSGLVRSLQTERAELLGRVTEQLGHVTRTHGELAATTGALREALSSSQARGQWGERLAEDVLRAAGMVRGVNYRVQSTTEAGNRPDLTFLLPDDRVLHMDVKFPLANYLAMLEVPDGHDHDHERDRLRAAFLRDVRARLKELSDRAYRDPQGGTLDLVLLFLPNERIFGFVHEHDPTLLDDALARKVVLCSPSTLFAVLAVIRQSVDAFTLERTGDEILALLGGFADQWDRLVAAMDKLGRAVTGVDRAYEELVGTRRAQFERQLRAVEELRGRRGIDARHQPPASPTDPRGK